MTLECLNSVAVPSRATSPTQLRAGPLLAPDAAASVRRSMVLDHCKWDPQVGDVSTISPFPLLMPEMEWSRLGAGAEALAHETISAEEDLLTRPELHSILAAPRRLRKALRDTPGTNARAAAVRVLRFDFHWTTDGWRVSEVNSDVPGGFAEASALPMLMASHGSPDLKPAGDPAGFLTGALAAASGKDIVVLLAAPGFIEDLQVTAYLARRFAEAGATAILAAPRQLEWRGGHCFIHLASSLCRVGAIVRFYQAEWLCRLPSACWKPFFAETEPVITNPASALLTESKRFPLTWNALSQAMPAWRRLLPESCDPRRVRWSVEDGWVLKPAYSNTGDTVAARAWTPPRQWRSIERSVRFFPRRWIAQRAFQTLPLPTPWGIMYPCIGVYTVGGRAAGAYVRLSRGPVIDYRAVDAALLIERRNQAGDRK